MPLFSPITLDRWRRFKRIRRAYWALWILGGLFLLSLFSEWIANNKPLVLGYGDRLYFPVLSFYPDSAFGGDYGTEANYRELRQTAHFREADGWMVFPPIPYSPVESFLNLPGAPPHPPSREHWLGTDGAARDVFVRILYGFRICMGFALALTALVTVTGVALGGIQGYAGGRIDLLGQRLTEIWSALPFLYVVILVGSIYGRSFTLLLLVSAAFSWAGTSLYMRAEFLKLRQLDFVTASRASGAGHFRVLFRQILPNAWTPVVTLLPFSLVGGIGTLTALDFLGFGLQPPTPSWGELLEQALKNLHAPWLAISAVSALFITLLLATFIGKGVRETCARAFLSQ